MSTIISNIGGASISVEICPALKDSPLNPRIAPDIQGFLSMMEKASWHHREAEFSRCLIAFLEEVDAYLDNGHLGRDEPGEPGEAEIILGTKETQEMDEFMEAHLPASVRRNLKKIGRK